MYAELTEPSVVPPLIIHLQKMFPTGRSQQVSFFQRIDHMLHNKEPLSLRLQAILAVVKKDSTKNLPLSCVPAELREQIIVQEDLMNEYYEDFAWCLKRGLEGAYRVPNAACMFDILNNFAVQKQTNFYFLETLRLVQQLTKEWFDRGFSEYGHVFHTVGEELLAKSVKSGNYYFVEWLLKFGVNPNYSDGDGSMIERAIWNDRLDIIQLFVAHGASVSKSSDRHHHGKNGPLWVACNNEKYKCAAWLISMGANVNELDNQNCSILMKNARNGYEDGVKLLLQNGAEVNLKDKGGRTALFAASGYRYSNPSNVELLLNHGAEIDARDLQLQTPLMHASKEGNSAGVKLLLLSGADSNAKDSNGENALFYAVSSFDENRILSIIKTLRMHRADINSRNNQGMHVVDCALKRYKDKREYGSSTEESEKVIKYLMSEKPKLSFTTRCVVFYHLNRKKIWASAFCASGIIGAYFYKNKSK
jgi:ankyrin repeat protein